MREGIEVVADAIVRRWDTERTLDLRSNEVEQVRAFLTTRGIEVRELPDGRYEVESSGTREACGAAQLLLLGLRRLLAARRNSPDR
jgi:hypothetical protein